MENNLPVDLSNYKIEQLGFIYKDIRKQAQIMEQFFGIIIEQQIIRYGNNNVNFEVFITNDAQKTRDVFTHSCLLIENRDEFAEKALFLGFSVIKVPRKDSDGFYLFVKDSFQNLYEIKDI